jgi:hypothetical protein
MCDLSRFQLEKAGHTKIQSIFQDKRSKNQDIKDFPKSGTALLCTDELLIHSSFPA